MKHTLKTITAIATIAVAGQAFAHTGVRDVVTESTATTTVSSYNGFTITHGCGGDSGQAYPVLGQSSLFPFGDQAVWRDSTGAVIAVGGDGNGTIVPATGIGLNLGVTGYSSASSSFVTAEEIVDDLGRVHALFWKNGAMQPQLNTVTPFKISAPKIANNCVKSLKVRIGVINYCDTNKNADNDATGTYKQPKDAYGRTIPLLADTLYGDGIQTNVFGAPVYTKMEGGNDDNNRADWWFTAPYNADGTSSALYNDPDLLQPTYWTTMTVNNTQADIDACVAGGGTPVDVSVEPSGLDFDTYLIPENVAPFSKSGGSGL